MTRPPAIPNPPVALALLADPPPSHRMDRRAIETVAGRRYRLFVAAPVRPAPPGGHPALYLLDGNIAFDALSRDDLAARPGLAVVAIGYETDAGFDFDARSRDYTPRPVSGSGLPEGSIRPHRPAGEADAFLAALETEFIPALEGEFGLDPGRRTLWGHSFGGLFALHALAHAPQLFAAYAVASPTLWWDEGRIIEEIGVVAGFAGVRVHLSAGAAENSVDAASADPGPGLAMLMRRLEGKPGIAVSIRTFAGATHRDALNRSLPDALALAAGA